MEWLHVTSPGDRLCPVKQLARYKSDAVHSISDKNIGPLPIGYELRGKARAPTAFVTWYKLHLEIRIHIPDLWKPLIWRQATAASIWSNAVSQTVPQASLKHTSSLPEPLVDNSVPIIRRISPVVQFAIDVEISTRKIINQHLRCKTLNINSTSTLHLHQTALKISVEPARIILCLHC